MATYGYIRVSLESQAESGLGLEAQRAAILTKWPDVAEWYADEGLSGTRADRPGLVTALDALKRGDVLAVAKRDRLSRDMYLDLWLERAVEKRGATIQCADGNGNGTDPAAVLMRRMLAAFSEFERGMIAARTAAALRAKRAAGFKTGGKCEYGWRDVGGGRLEPVPEEQAVIRQAREMRAAGKGMSLRHIARALGLRHPMQVQRMLREVR